MYLLAVPFEIFIPRNQAPLRLATGTLSPGDTVEIHLLKVTSAYAGATAFFTMKKGLLTSNLSAVANSLPAFSSTGSLVQILPNPIPAGGIVSFTLSPSQTAALDLNSNYSLECQLTLTDGTVESWQIQVQTGQDLVSGVSPASPAVNNMRFLGNFASAPVGQEGDVYFNTTSAEYLIYRGGGWRLLVSGAVPTNLGYSGSPTQGLITSDTGNDATIPAANDTNAGLFLPTEKTKLAGIQAGAQVNNISDVNATDLTDGGDTTLHTHDSRYYTETEVNTLLSGKQNTITNSDSITEGTTNLFFTTAERTKLSGIAAGAEVNVNADWNAVSGDAQILNKPTIPTFTSQLTNDSNFITSAQAPVQPADIANFETTTQLNARDTANRDRANHTGTQAISTVTGLQTALDGKQAVGDYATNTALTNGLATKENTITAGTTSQYWRGDKTFQTLDKTAVGLANVDNTSDLNKPVSTATQTALDLKEYKLFVTIGTSNADYITDGTADDVQFQAAFDAINTAGGGTLYIKKGTYNLAAEVTVYGNTKVIGDEGAVINAVGVKPVSGLRYAFKTTNSAGKENITFQNVKIIGDYTDGTVSTFATTPAVGGILINNTSGVLIENCEFERCWNDVVTGISSTSYDATLAQDNTKKVLFMNNRSINTLGGFQCYSTTEVTWDGNFFENFGDDAIAYLTINHTESKAIITNNHFKNGRPQNSNGVFGVGIGIKLDGSATPGNISDIIITNNTFESCHEGIWANTSINYLIKNNTFRNTRRNAIKLSDSANEGIVEGNILIANNTENSASYAPVYINGSNNIKVINNYIEGGNLTNERAIRTGGTSSDIEIKGNTIRNSGGVLFDVAATTNLSITDNTITASSNTARFMLASTITAPFTFARNQITGAVTASQSIYISGTPILNILQNELYAVNNQLLLDASTITRLIFQGNIFRNFTGNTTDGHAVARFSCTSASGTIIIDSNTIRSM